MVRKARIPEGPEGPEDPEDSETETGYAWHPWHYRYVGEDAAGNIHSLGITLEEYLSMFFSEEAAVVYDKS